MADTSIASGADALFDRRATVRAVLVLATPAIGQSLLETLVFLVDRAMLGRHGSASLAAMQICGPLAWSIYSVIGAFSAGTVALVGRATGAQEPGVSSAALRASLFIALGAGALAAGLGLLLLGPILSLFPAASPQVQDAARGYLQIALPAMPLLLVEHVAAVTMAASGNTRAPFLVALGANAINVALNWVLIFGNLGAPALGARGAAIGTLVAIAASAVCLLVLLGRRDGVVTWRGRGGEWQAIRRIVRVAGPAFAEKAVQHAGFFGFVTMIGALGSVAMAANQALVSIESVCFLSADGFGLAAASMVSRRLGARRPREATFGALTAVALAVALLAACGLLFVAIPRALLFAFSPDVAIVAAGLPCLYVAAVAAPFMGASIVLANSVRGAGDTRTAFAVTLVGGLVVRLIATYLFAFTLELGLVGVWLGSTADWIVRCLILSVVFARGRWRTASV